MTLDHSLVEELMSANALGGLDDDDRALLLRERAAHGDCAECRAIETGFAETAGRLAFALTPAPVDDPMIDRILASPREERLASVAAAAADPPDELSERRARRPRGWQALVAAAAVSAMLVVSVGTLAPSTTGVNLVSASQRIVTFEGSDTEATLAMAYTPGEPGAVFWGSGLRDPGAGAVYEIWMIEDGEPTSGGCVLPTDGVIALAVDASVGSSEAIGVTSESSECPASPTGPLIFSADLTTAL